MLMVCPHCPDYNTKVISEYSTIHYCIAVLIGDGFDKNNLNEMRCHVLQHFTG